MLHDIKDNINSLNRAIDDSGGTYSDMATALIDDVTALHSAAEALLYDNGWRKPEDAFSKSKCWVSGTPDDDDNYTMSEAIASVMLSMVTKSIVNVDFSDPLVIEKLVKKHAEIKTAAE